ncbi:hypothetical protein DUI87_33131 [Hirundo rustica rustica]|uniref:Superoxide dismutase copper chaperone n=1 Tax=Hirundo rustica rustica TaxID=333673 RepID=A0A3M0IRQ5_HIRRU|nr:hypothetical protein DUI87_33131 [Hirundo rustica rustica]
MSHTVLLLRRLRERRRHRNRDSDEEQDWDRHGGQDHDRDRDQHREREQDHDNDRDKHRERHREREQDHDSDRDQHRDRDEDRERDQDRAQDLHHASHPTPPCRSSLPAPSGGPSTPSPSPSPRRGRRRRRPYPAQRIYRVRCSFLELSEEQALRRCRLDRAAIAALCRELGADLQSLTGRSHALPVAVKVTSALAFLASGSFQTASRLSTGISQSAMSNCLAQFLAALQRRAPRYIAFPPPPAPPGDPPALPGVLGLVGAMHVALRAPADNEPLFRNAANFHSINMQVVCDRHGAITNVVAKFPGSCPNATVLENSALARLMEGTRPEGVWLLGDRTYPLKPWLLTPISGPRGAAELRYNALHARTLDPLRRTLGLLRCRFRCLAGGGLQYSPPKLEFAVQMSCHGCADAVRAALDAAPDVKLLELRPQEQSVLVETTAAAERVRELLENSGCRAVLKGMGGSPEAPPGGAAVAALGGPGGVRGLVRFLQLSPGRCLVDGAVSGLPPGPHGLHIHEFGDLSDPCNSCGGHFNPDGESHGGPQDQHRHAGDLGNIWADSEGRARFRIEDTRLKVWDIIGRSVVVAEGEDDLGRGSHPLSRVTGNSGPGNPKRVCSCDGVTLWEERDRSHGTLPGTPAMETPSPHL